MIPGIPTAPLRCTECDRGHYVAVRFCPFCGAAQVRPKAEPPAPPPPPPDVHEPPPVDTPPEPTPPSAPPTAAPPPPPAEPDPVPPGAVWTVSPVPRRRKSSVRPRQVVLALAAIGALAGLALARREVIPAPTRIEVGPAWTAVALKSFRNATSLRITAEGVISLRLDGERVQRVSPSSGATVRPKTLRSLELRSGRGAVTVTLTPRAE
ncbi:hypothetical protein MKL09_02800 [Methylobacterium sp. J-048]|uniref:hypothetical protein n=1 Tax=Methylobacterium sp. J-048 TaxID=2836635 RepID=UPI001FBB216C|nr:hypothetical protein [Methylobacterium sp. J-048]MCJ2055476.1 hypothetical protein [Methylobacterium sp. J-048]